jgi:hypothetical protein
MKDFCEIDSTLAGKEDRFYVGWAECNEAQQQNVGLHKNRSAHYSVNLTYSTTHNV